MKGNDRYYLNDPNYYKSLNFAGINNHLKGLSNSRKIVLSDIYHHCIKKKKNKNKKKKRLPHSCSTNFVGLDIKENNPSCV